MTDYCEKFQKGGLYFTKTIIWFRPKIDDVPLVLNAKEPVIVLSEKLESQVFPNAIDGREEKIPYVRVLSKFGSGMIYAAVLCDNAEEIPF